MSPLKKRIAAAFNSIDELISSNTNAAEDFEKKGYLDITSLREFLTFGRESFDDYCLQIAEAISLSLFDPSCKKNFSVSGCDIALAPDMVCKLDSTIGGLLVEIDEMKRVVLVNESALGKALAAAHADSQS